MDLIAPPGEEVRHPARVDRAVIAGEQDAHYAASAWRRAASYAASTRPIA